MNDTYSIPLDFMELMSGTTNRTADRYLREAAHIAAERIDSDGEQKIKRLVKSIDRLAASDKAKDSRISKSRGSIKGFKGYESILYMEKFLSKYMAKDEPMLKQLKLIHKKILDFTSYYQNSYNTKSKLGILEYENAVYLLMTGLAYLMINGLSISSKDGRLVVQKTSRIKEDLITSLVKKLSVELDSKEHAEYLQYVNQAPHAMKEAGELSPFEESTVADTIDAIIALGKGGISLAKKGFRLVKFIRRSFFGIIPTIRSILYLRYKKKADVVSALEQQCAWIQINIEQLERKTNIDPKEKAQIIKRQEAIIRAYQKKADKLRAELNETVRDASEEAKKDEDEIQSSEESTQDGDLVLESGLIFFERKNAANIRTIRKHQFMKKFDMGGKVIPKNDMGLTVDNIEDTIATAYKKIAHKTGLPIINLKVTKSQEKEDADKRIASKFGGIPYWPKDMTWPTKDHTDLIMIAQLNFGELTNIEGFPTDGILQLFINPDVTDAVGMTECVAIYHDKVDSNVELLEEVPCSTLDLSKVDDSDDFPFEGVIYLGDEGRSTSVINTSEEEWAKVAFPILKEAFKADWNAPSDMPNEVWKAIFNEENHWNVYGSRVGGHPFFVQADPRTSEEEDFLLLQIDSELGIIWGDYGTAHFFCKKSDIAKKNFKHVKFEWSCT